LNVGRDIKCVIILQQQFFMPGDVNIYCLIEFMLIEPTEKGKVGIAAKISRYEFVPAAANAA